MSHENQEHRGEGVQLCPDGAYRWVYEYRLLSNPTILFTLFKILGAILGIGALFLAGSVLHSMASGNATTADLIESLRSIALFVLFFFALILVGYVVYAAMNGWKYCVVFTMNEEGIRHKQMPRSFEKARLVSELAVLAGLVSGSPTAAGIGLMSTRDQLTSDFSAVRSIRGYRRRCTIKVNEPLAKNQVYTEPADYDFVFGYIVQHCPQATVKE